MVGGREKREEGQHAGSVPVLIDGEDRLDPSWQTDL